MRKEKEEVVNEWDLKEENFVPSFANTNREGFFVFFLVQSQIFCYYSPNKSNWENQFTPQKFTPKTFMAEMSFWP